MGYYVYENWAHERARVHIDSCPYCKHGRGTQPQDGGRNGRWLPGPGRPFATREEAFRRAQTKGWEDSKGCKYCKP